MNPAPRRRDCLSDDRGQTSAFVIGVLMGLWLFTGIVVDGGLALAAKTRAMDTAQEAARTAAQHLDLAALRHEGTTRLDPQQAEAAALDYIAATGDEAHVTVEGDTVTVQFTSHLDTQVLQLAGLHDFTISATATAHAATGTQQEAAAR